MAEQGRKRVIRRIKYFTSRVDRFYAKYDVHNYASNIRISRQKLLFMHKLYRNFYLRCFFRRKTQGEIFESLPNATESFPKFLKSLCKRNDGLAKKRKIKAKPCEKNSFFVLYAPLRFVKIILHKRTEKPSVGSVRLSVGAIRLFSKTTEERECVRSVRLHD